MSDIVAPYLTWLKMIHYVRIYKTVANYLEYKLLQMLFKPQNRNQAKTMMLFFRDANF